MSEERTKSPDHAPDPGVLYGVTHGLDGEPIIRRPFLTKIQIGLSPGPDLEVWFEQLSGFFIREGIGRTQKLHKNLNREDVEDLYLSLRENSKTPKRQAPGKLSYFTFSIADEEGNYLPDFDAIEAHGLQPRRIPVLFTSEHPFRANRQLHGKSGLQCWGDGRDGHRSIKFGQNDEEKKLAKEAESRGERFFLLAGKCREFGCPFGTGSNPKCPPHGRLEFHLSRIPRIGGTSRFETTSFGTIRDLHSSLFDIGAAFDTLIGPEFELVLRPVTYQDPSGNRQHGFSVHVEPTAAALAGDKSKLARRSRPSPPEEVEVPDDQADEILDHLLGANSGEGEDRLGVSMTDLDDSIEAIYKRMTSPLTYQAELMRLRNLILNSGGAKEDVDGIFQLFAMKDPSDIEGHTPTEMKKLALLLWEHLDSIVRTSGKSNYEATDEDLPENLRG